MGAIETGYKHIVITPGTRSGKPRIDGHRIAVEDIAHWYNQGIRPEEIVGEDIYPWLELVEVYAALTYYLDHKAEIDAEVATDRVEIAKLAAEHPSPNSERVLKIMAERRRNASHA